MIILVTLLAVCYAAYAFWIVDWTTDKFDTIEVCMLVGLFCIMMPLAILAQVLTSMGVIK
jgi:hypothetical protein